MRIERSWRLRIFSCTALLLLVTAFAPRTAQASCGDYLANHWDSRMVVIERTNALGLGNVTADAAPVSSANPDSKPCQGPSCRSSQPVPIPAPAPERILQDHPAIVMNSDDVWGIQAHAIRQDPDSLQSQVAEGGIFHPPRA